jgi:thiosulfate dehydrogenase
MARATRLALKIIAIAGAGAAFYALALHEHEGRDARRAAAVDLTPACKEKLARFALESGERFVAGHRPARGYRDEDVRAIQRGCNLVDDLQGKLAADGAASRWNATRFVRGSRTSCDHCHQGIGDKRDATGRPQIGSNSLAASWVMADMYDRFTGLLLSYEMRQMQCYINSSNGFKPNAVDDVLRDVTAYSRFLSAALDLRIGEHYPEQGIDEIPASATLKRGDDYVRGAHLYRQQCAACHGAQALGTVVDAKLAYPALAGPHAFSHDSRMNFAMVNSVMPGFICRNMPPGREGSLSNQDCRDIAYYLSTLPRPAGDKQGPLAAAWQQLMMGVLPPLARYADAIRTNGDSVIEENGNLAH